LKVRRLKLRWRNIYDPLNQPSMIEAVDPFQIDRGVHLQLFSDSRSTELVILSGSDFLTVRPPRRLISINC